MNHLISNTHIMTFFVKPAATSQSGYKVFTILYLFRIVKIILYLIDDATIILQVADIQL
jgi:hypothetical protein